MKKYLSKEISWLKFNRRVLAQAKDETLPLADRIRFLGIYSKNLDEFFMKRIGGLKRQAISKINQISEEGKTPESQINFLKANILPDQNEINQYFVQQILPELSLLNIELVGIDELSKKDKEFLSDYFDKNIFPMLTPYVVDAGHPFPMISNLSTSLGVLLDNPQSTEPQFVRMKVSHFTPQWIELPKSGNKNRFILISNLMKVMLNKIFPLFNIIECSAFRITRNADLAINDDEAEDLLELVEQELKQRRFAQVVRLQYRSDADTGILDFIKTNLDLDDLDIYKTDTLFDYSILGDIVKSCPHLPRSKPWIPTKLKALDDDSTIINYINRSNLLVHHPYESFRDSTERFLREAVYDDKVQTIKITLYRTSEDSTLVSLLARAAEWGKQVVCMLELKARFDEERNIQWAQTLEDVGVQVVYGIPGLKVHGKMLIVVRKEVDGVKTYAHVGTGNYNERTAEIYTDYGLFTANQKITNQLLHVYNYITGRSIREDYSPLLVAPVNLKICLIALIKTEIDNAKNGKPSRIIAKMNGLDDKEVIQELYKASNAGVKISLIVRGICSLKPKVKKMSENIEVISILDKFLEHSRVWFFKDGNKKDIDGKVFIGSADWMQRNLNRRVEIMVPILEKNNKENCINSLNLALSDYKQSWELQSDGDYKRRTSNSKKKQESLQESLMRSYLED